ncbi:MAG: hypothetical protein PHV74_09595 [Dehalococcoidia bacterium]|nr:hypothetical protein [Dehalococcoidia bacterium]
MIRLVYKLRIVYSASATIRSIISRHIDIPLILPATCLWGKAALFFALDQRVSSHRIASQPVKPR